MMRYDWFCRRFGGITSATQSPNQRAFTVFLAVSFSQHMMRLEIRFTRPTADTETGDWSLLYYIRAEQRDDTNRHHDGMTRAHCYYLSLSLSLSNFKI